MAWFDDIYYFTTGRLRIAHVTDSHLFAQRNGEYFSVNTAVHFSECLADISQQDIDCLVFGGDLTQDHSAESYFLFAQLIAESPLQCPVFWLPGNHDDIALLTRISGGQIQHHKRLKFNTAEVLLLNSKGPTPAGWVSAQHLNELTDVLTDNTAPCVCFCHHNPLPINGYLDKHILENGPQLLNLLVNNGRTQALFHGHVHNEHQWQFRDLNIYASPASSIQFLKNTAQWQQQNKGPMYRIVTCNSAGINQPFEFSTEVVCLNG
ncbi:metallophosphoesterase [Pseudoalteromonas mariniglutinosa]|uniref:metallophosphoesterase n=1 Tax=Pseudoalteromonas mariniglutinosa TaxID=206042 RepID=UPI00384A87B0